MSTHKASVSLAEGESRFDRLIRQVKDGQVARSQRAAPVPVALNPVFAPSPDEVWARQHMALGIGPAADFRLPEKQLPKRPATHDPEPEPVVAAELLRPAAPRGRYAPKLPSASDQDRFGGSLGHDRSGRSWLGRLFRRR